MLHSELVQEATDLLSECRNTSYWLESYDAALAADSDQALCDLVERLRVDGVGSNILVAA